MLTVITNNAPRELVCLADLPVKARADFDYIDGDDPYTPRLFKYRGAWYDAHEFERVGHEHPANQMRTQTAHAWDGIQANNYFSAVLLRWYRDPFYGDRAEPDYERVVVGRCYS